MTDEEKGELTYKLIRFMHKNMQVTPDNVFHVIASLWETLSFGPLDKMTQDEQHVFLNVALDYVDVLKRDLMKKLMEISK